MGVMCRRGHCYLLDESSFHVFCGLWSSFHGNLARCRHRLHAWDEWVLLLTGDTAFSAHRRNCFIRLLCLVGSCPVIPIWKIFWVDWFCSGMSCCWIGWDNGTRLQVSQLWLYCCWAICLTDDVVLHALYPNGNLIRPVGKYLITRGFCWMSKLKSFQIWDILNKWYYFIFGVDGDIECNCAINLFALHSQGYFPWYRHRWWWMYAFGTPVWYDEKLVDYIS